MSWVEVLSSLDAIIADLSPDPSWEAGKTLSRKRQEVEGALDADLAALAEEADFVFSPDLDPAMYVRQVAELFRSWSRAGKGPSLCALCMFAMRRFGLNEDDPLARAVLMAALLGEVDNALPYHNNAHFREVLLQTVGLIALHNEIYENQPQELHKDHIGLLLIAACIHDLAHDGKSNAEGIYVPSRAEKRSFALAKPFLIAAGLEDVELEDILVLLLATDVSALEGRQSPAAQVKRAYRKHFLNAKEGPFGEGLELLEKRADLALMGVLLHEADLSTSAGLDYGVTAFETALYREETAKDRARPSHIVAFIEKICGGDMLSAAGRKLFSAPMVVILERARQDAAMGDQPFPPADELELLPFAAEVPPSGAIN